MKEKSNKALNSECVWDWESIQDYSGLAMYYKERLGAGFFNIPTVRITTDLFFSLIEKPDEIISKIAEVSPRAFNEAFFTFSTHVSGNVDIFFNIESHMPGNTFCRYFEDFSTLDHHKMVCDYLRDLSKKCGKLHQQWEENGFLYHKVHKKNHIESEINTIE